MTLLKPAVPKKTNLPITHSIKLGNGEAVATDLETMIIANLSEAQDSMLIPFQTVYDLTRHLPSYEMIRLESKRNKLSVSWSDGNAIYPTDSFADFPALPAMETTAEGKLDGDVIIKAIVKALPYVSSEETRPVLTGVTIVLGNPIEVIGADGFRMSYQVFGMNYPLEKKIVIPARSVSILEHVFAKTPRTPPLYPESLIQIVTAKRMLGFTILGENKLRVDFGQNASVIINLVEGNPPDYANLIPKKEPKLKAKLFAPQLDAAVNRVRGVALDGNRIIRFEFAQGDLSVSAKNDDQEIKATLAPMEVTGEPGRVALDYKYIHEFLTGKEGFITLSQFDELGPLLFQYQNDPKVLLMPMQVQWGDDGEKEQAQPETHEKTAPEFVVEKPGAESIDDIEAFLEEKADQRDRELDAAEEEVKAEREADGDDADAQLPESIADDGTIAVAQEEAAAEKKPSRKHRKK